MRRGRGVAKRLKAELDRQNFEVVIQARVGSKVLARERLPPLRKDVLTTKAGKNVGGGDVTRKKKVLEKQKKGKARQKTIGGVTATVSRRGTVWLRGHRHAGRPAAIG